MKLIELIQSLGDNWKNTLEKEPYNLNIKEDGDLVLFMYNQISSDFSLQEVRESRGVILERDTWKVVCRAFDKFFNIQEKYAANIDWHTAKVQEKVDGSIIKLFTYNGNLKLATNGTINAFDANLPLPDKKFKTFGDLAAYAITNNISDEKLFYLNDNYTYIFEVVSPYNRVVVPYKEIDVYHIGTRDNVSGEEVEEYIGIKKPKVFDFLKNKEDILSMAEELDYNNEGFVVVDDNYNRVKIKTPDYLRVHKIKGEDIPTPKNILEMIKNEQDDDFIALFPEYSDLFYDVKSKLQDYLSKIEKDIEEYKNNTWEDRKDFANNFAKQCTFPDLMFKLYSGTASLENWTSEVMKIPSKKLAEIIGAKD